MSLEHIVQTSTLPLALPTAIQNFVEQITAKKNILAILFYGSSLWAKDTDTILDFYIICDILPDWHKTWNIKAVANYILPPNVEYSEYKTKDYCFKAKIAIISLRQFYRACKINALDTTIWARFCQPTQLIWARDDLSKQYIYFCLKEAIQTACFWAAILGPVEGKAEQYWLELFKHTYQTELRVEAKNRPLLILQGREEYFTQILEAAWKNLSLPFEKKSNNNFELNISSSQRKKYLIQWSVRAWLGKPLNILRLLKAAFTFENGVDYIMWKINRHTSIDINLSPFEISHPLISLPLIMIKLYKKNFFKIKH